MTTQRSMLVFTMCAGLLAVNAWADDNGGNGGNGGGDFQGQIVGSMVGEHVAGVPSGGAPWVVASGQFDVTAGGRIQAQIRGLLISSGPAINTVGPVTMVKASLACGDVVVASTAPVNLTTTGNASIRDTVTVPASCIAPALLIQIAATTTGPVANGPFIAVNALSGNAGAQNDNRDHGDNRDH
jgi:hypothetical protein